MEKSSNSAAAKWGPYLLSLLRIAVGIVFIRHGMQLLFGFPFGGMNHNFLTLNGMAGPLAFAGGVLVILGLFTRPVTFVLSGMMAIAFFAGPVYETGSLWTLKNDGEAAAFYCFVYLLLSAAGGGVLSLDHLIWGKVRGARPFASPEWTPYLLSIMRFMAEVGAKRFLAESDRGGGVNLFLLPLSPHVCSRWWSVESGPASEPHAETQCRQGASPRAGR